ncbi:hypothetical protein IEO21_09532 [Rhodonia placenta]|uniref:Uncharacterized protein n=1 Tax=Rhodonia placenta TaxID=104341 RepID=A0A8H7NUA4_9APHY|nr:hypothetical protein IEO21_09532 [Postia placenta]
MWEGTRATNGSMKRRMMA